MARDAIPGFEIKELVRQLAAGETLERLEAQNPSISRGWFKANGPSLLKLAGKAEPEKPVAVAPKK